MENASHQGALAHSGMGRGRVHTFMGGPPMAMRTVVTALIGADADIHAVLQALADSHRYPEPLDEPPPNVEPIPPELPQPEPAPADPTPGQLPMKAASARQRSFAQARC